MVIAIPAYNPYIILKNALNMKALTSIVLLFILSYTNHLNAQDGYLPTITKGALMTYYINLGMGSTSECLLEVTCDSIVQNGKTYYYATEASLGAPNYCDERELYLREDTSTQKVYFLDPESESGETMYLNYDLEPGDTMSYMPEGYELPNSLVIASIHEEYIQGAYRRVYQYAAPDLKLIEGLGRLYTGPFPPPNALDKWRLLLEREFTDCLISGTHSPPDARISVFPNPATDQLFVQLEGLLTSAPARIQIHTLDGRKWLDHHFSGKSIQLNTHNFPKTLLLVRVSQGGRVLVEKVMHQ